MNSNQLSRCKGKRAFQFLTFIFTYRWSKIQGEDMTILSNIAVVLALACIAHLVLVADCQRGHGKKGRKDGKGSNSGNRERLPKAPPTKPADRNEKEQKTPTVKGVFKGKFSGKNMTCTWVATGEDSFTLGVNCKKGGNSFDCQYTGRPTACPQYASGVKVYWKQIARSLKKQKALCKDPATLVRTGLCKNAPKVAHFKLNSAPRKHPQTTTQSPPTSGSKSCAGEPKQRAEEYCSDSWSKWRSFL
ncbi:hypothetical protein AAFF_G00192300 [Aldrovandia affinis]|uniref:Uncharacterized protein n=1 Tax=Aldrovandia affinis TaxID=143900 RepID=A0AAD7RJ64_9TELE|nr:hypothetical protein AAFF_G00192300 [Aldrovandia affinis]